MGIEWENIENLIKIMSKNGYKNVIILGKGVAFHSVYCYNASNCCLKGVHL